MEQIKAKKQGGVDVILILLVISLMIMGLLMLSNATGFPNVEEGADWLQYVAAMNKYFIIRHIIWFTLGLVLAGVVMAFDYKIYGELTMFIYIVSLILLACVRIFGTEQFGQYRWEIFNQEIQPSEVAKLTLILVLAWDISRLENGIQTPKQLGKILIKVFIPLGLIMLQPDIGTALVYVFITAIMLFVSGTRAWMMWALIGTGIGAVFPIWPLLPRAQKFRILTFLDPTLDPTGTGYNVIHSKMAIGSGQMSGKGFFNPIAMSQLSYIPVQESDFIFAVTGETLGFWWSALVILLFAGLILRLVMLSMQTRDKFGSYIIIGVAAMMLFHVFENIGMSIGLMPVTGIPLPFFSYGGSSMITNMMGIGLVLCVFMRRKKGASTKVINFR